MGPAREGSSTQTGEKAGDRVRSSVLPPPGGLLAGLRRRLFPVRHVQFPAVLPAPAPMRFEPRPLEEDGIVVGMVRVELSKGRFRRRFFHYGPADGVEMLSRYTGKNSRSNSAVGKKITRVRIRQRAPKRVKQNENKRKARALKREAQRSMATTRAGAAEAPTIFKGNTATSKPYGGSAERFVSCSMCQ